MPKFKIVSRVDAFGRLRGGGRSAPGRRTVSSNSMRSIWSPRCSVTGGANALAQIVQENVDRASRLMTDESRLHWFRSALRLP